MPCPRPVSLPSTYTAPAAGPPCDLVLDGRAGVVWPDQPWPEVPAERYPDTGGLARDLADRWRITPDRVLVTAGADDALDRACRAYLSVERTAVFTDPTFAMLPRYVALAGAGSEIVPWSDDPFPAAAMDRAARDRTGLLAIVSPNNPTGLVAPLDAVLDLADAHPQMLVVVDLAYVEFADSDPTRQLLTRENVLVVRTLSKAWGLAAARIGYAMGAPEVVRALAAAGGPYPTSAAGLATARRRLGTGDRELADRVARTRRERRRLSALLTASGLDVPRSQANFVLARGERAPWLADGLAGLGIAVRQLGDQGTRIGLPANGPAFARLWRGCRAALAPESLLLDIDGVVADVRGSYRAAIQRTAAVFGHAVTANEIAAAKTRPDSNNDWRVTQRLLAEAGRQVPLEAVTACFESVIAENELWREERLIPPRDVLSRLAARLPLVAVTGRPRRDADRFLATAGIAELFTAMVTMEDAPAKPDPEPIRLGLARAGVRRAWMVGDTPDDLIAARAAGVVPVGVVAPGDPIDSTQKRLIEAGAARVVTDLVQLEEWLP
jgi:histidinol-phosphate aminotransferase